jgi:hypothetical protein
MEAVHSPETLEQTPYVLYKPKRSSLEEHCNPENILRFLATLLCHSLALEGKAALLQAWSGPEGFRKLRFPDFLTMAQDGGKVVSLMHWPHIPPGNTPGTHFC